MAAFFGSNARPRFFAAAAGFAAAFSPPEVCWAYSGLKLLPETWRQRCFGLE